MLFKRALFLITICQLITLPFAGGLLWALGLQRLGGLVWVTDLFLLLVFTLVTARPYDDVTKRF